MSFDVVRNGKKFTVNWFSSKGPLLGKSEEFTIGLNCFVLEYAFFPKLKRFSLKLSMKKSSTAPTTDSSLKLQPRTVTASKRLNEYQVLTKNFNSQWLLSWGPIQHKHDFASLSEKKKLLQVKFFI